MPQRSGREPPGGDLGPMGAAAQQHRGVLMMEALIAACAVIAQADGKSSAIERWRLATVLADDKLLAALPQDIAATASANHRRDFLADPAAARAAALEAVARLAPEPQKALMVFDACLLVTRADERTHPAELQTLRDVKAALGL